MKPTLPYVRPVRYASRAALTIAAAAWLGAPGAFAASASLPYDGELAFTVLRGGKPIGRHEIAFREVGDEMHVDIDIELAVKIGFITVFRYEHSNREVWRDGRVVSVITETNDDGDAFAVDAERTAQGLHVETLTEERIVPGNAIPTSYWNPMTLRNLNWLDTQRGIMLDVAVDPKGMESVALSGGATVAARRYEVTGDLTLTMWYTPKGEWVKLAFPARGSDIEYVLEQESQSADATPDN